MAVDDLRMTDRDVPESASPTETAYYYPEPYWLEREGGWVKSLLLCFDEIAILLPKYMYGVHDFVDPTLAGPIEELGLLRILEPESFVDDEMATQLTDSIESLVDGGAFDALTEVGGLAELSMSRMGYATVRQVAQRITAKLKSRGLAASTADGVSIPMHPEIRSAYLLLLAQLAREAGARQGLDLHPVTNGRGTGAAVKRLLDLERMPSRGQIIDLDLQTVGVDLDDIPLDDVLQFKRESGGAHRRYMQNLRAFSLDLSLMGELNRHRAISDRVAELQDEASDLRRRSLAAWRTPKDATGFALGITGAAWSVATGNLVPAALAGIGAGLKMLPSKAQGTAYSYLFEARRKLD